MGEIKNKKKSPFSPHFRQYCGPQLKTLLSTPIIEPLFPKNK